MCLNEITHVLGALSTSSSSSRLAVLNSFSMRRGSTTHSALSHADSMKSRVVHINSANRSEKRREEKVWKKKKGEQEKAKKEKKKKKKGEQGLRLSH